MTESLARGYSRKQRGIVKQNVEKGYALVFARRINNQYSGIRELDAYD